MVIFDGSGYFLFDAVVTALIFLAAVSQFSAMWFNEGHTNRSFMFGKFVAGCGLLIWGTRFTTEIAIGGDPQITLPGLVSITLITVGLAISSFFGKITK